MRLKRVDAEENWQGFLAEDFVGLVRLQPTVAMGLLSPWKGILFLEREDLVVVCTFIIESMSSEALLSKSENRSQREDFSLSIDSLQ